MSSGNVFNIGSQQGGTINNVAGDQTIGQLNASFQVGTLQAVADLRGALAETTLPDPARQAVDQVLDDVEDELHQRTPDKHRVAGRLEEAARVLGGCGALVAAADRLAGPLQHLAGWLGPAGHALAALLP